MKQGVELKESGFLGGMRGQLGSHKVGKLTENHGFKGSFDRLILLDSCLLIISTAGSQKLKEMSFKVFTICMGG